MLVNRAIKIPSQNKDIQEVTWHNYLNTWDIIIHPLNLNPSIHTDVTHH
jgi:hypothetical protein